MQKHYYIKTYGCQMNVHESEKLAGMLKSLDYTETNDMANADVIVFNTCCIRNAAEQKILGNIGSVKKLKKLNPNLVVAVCGCMAQEEGRVELFKEKYPYVSIVFGTHNLHKFKDYLIQYNKDKQRIFDVWDTEKEINEDVDMYRTSDNNAWVNIMYGCNNFCTYCIVPYVRGRERSRKPEDIENEIKDLVSKGYKEVTLLGQNVNSYGKDLYNDYSFASLLEDVAKTNIPRLRFTTSHPWDFTQEMFDVISKYDNIMPYIHLPLQSGSDEVLKRMGRRYTSSSYKKLVDDLKRTIPNVALSTDIIVGFPNETDEEFEKTMEMVEYCQYDFAFTFIYSPRVGTPAAKINDNVSSEVKHARFDRLVKRINEIGVAKYQTFVGKEVEVLVEGFSKKENDILTGYTKDMKLVNFKGNPQHIGQFVKVKILEGHLFYLSGEEIDG